MMFRFPSVICTRCTGFFCLAIIKGPPNDIYCIIEEPSKHYFTEKVSYSPKIPSSNKIQKQIENLKSEQTATVQEKQELQKKLKTLEIIQQNFTALLNAPEIQIPVSGKEPTL